MRIQRFIVSPEGLALSNLPSIGHENNTALPKGVLVLHLVFHCFSPFSCCLSVCLITWITSKILMLYFHLINSVLLNLLCVCFQFRILFASVTFGGSGCRKHVKFLSQLAWRLHAASLVLLPGQREPAVFVPDMYPGVVRAAGLSWDTCRCVQSVPIAVTKETKFRHWNKIEGTFQNIILDFKFIFWSLSCCCTKHVLRRYFWEEKKRGHSFSIGQSKTCANFLGKSLFRFVFFSSRPYFCLFIRV